VKRAIGAMWAALALYACGGTTGPELDAGNDAGVPVACGAILPLSGEPDPPSKPVDCHALDGYELSLDVDDPNLHWVGEDFETGAATGWYVNNDFTGRQMPKPDTDPVPGQEIPGGRCLGVPHRESRFAMHIVSGVLTDYGGVFGRNLPRRYLTGVCPINSCPDRVSYPATIGPCGTGQGNAPQPPADPDSCTASKHENCICLTGDNASGWEGLVLWARKAQGSASSIRVQFGDVHTDDSNQACECNNQQRNPEGMLISATNQNDSSNGCDKFGSFATLDGTWRPYLFPFNRMQQGGWGKPSLGFDASQIFSISINYGRGAWDLWIDDISYYRRKK